eukprot:jgi/Mesen1/7248/ME000373S06313
MEGAGGGQGAAADGAGAHVVGLISDTHGLLDDSAVEILKRATDLILHAGDVGDAKKRSRLPAVELLQQLEERTGRKVLAVAGNTDVGGIPLHDGAPLSTQLLPAWRTLVVAGLKILMTHISGFPPKQDATAGKLVAQETPDVVVFGHSHALGAAEAGGALYINPGSAGPQRFKLPRCVALLHVSSCTGASVEFVSLSGTGTGGTSVTLPSPILRRPCTTPGCPQCLQSFSSQFLNG